MKKDPSIYERPIQSHSGSKYLRLIHPADDNGKPILVDVYCVLEAFGITCPARQHAIKKMLCAGVRGKADQMKDLHETLEAMWRAVTIQRQRESKEMQGVP
jgi:hypothetical protein